MLIAVAVFAYGSVYGSTIEMPTLTLALVADGATLLAFASLIDVATRLRKTPPWWLAMIIGVGILAFNGDVIGMLGIALSQGAWIFVPFAWSLIERIRELWTLPSASPLEKIRRRTLVFDRLYVGIAIMGLWICAGLVMVFVGDKGIESFFDVRLLIIVGLVFYAIAAANVWRVHGSAYAQRPSSLMPWFDKGNAVQLDPL